MSRLHNKRSNALLPFIKPDIRLLSLFLVFLLTRIFTLFQILQLLATLDELSEKNTAIDSPRTPEVRKRDRCSCDLDLFCFACKKKRSGSRSQVTSSSNNRQNDIDDRRKTLESLKHLEQLSSQRNAIQHRRRLTNLRNILLRKLWKNGRFNFNS